MDAKQRNKITRLIQDTLLLLEPEGKNSSRYKENFKKMSDKEFQRWVKELLGKDENNISIEVLPHVNEPSFESIKAAADHIGVPLEEYVYYRHDTDSNGKAVRTRVKVPVGFIIIKRMQQILSKKNAFSYDVKARNALTGTVAHDDKVASNTDSEVASLVVVGGNSILKELMGPRADNFTAKQQMYKDISLTGYVRLDNLPRDVTEQTTLNTVDVFLLGAGLNSDLITDSDLLTSTLKGSKG